jgi:hypothetical protein
MLSGSFGSIAAGRKLIARVCNSVYMTRRLSLIQYTSGKSDAAAKEAPPDVAACGGDKFHPGVGGLEHDTAAIAARIA